MEKEGGDGVGAEDHQSVFPWLTCSAIFALSLFIVIELPRSSSFWTSLNGPKMADYSLSFEDLKRKVINHDYHRQPQPISSTPSPSDNFSFSRESLATHHKPSVPREYQKVEEGLAVAREVIRKTIHNSTRNKSLFSNTTIYHNPDVFYQSYAEMEKRLKVYVYEEGDLPIVHDGPCKERYSSEGKFIQEMEHGDNGFRTKDPYSAHVYFMPFSVTRMVAYLYTTTENQMVVKDFVSDYVRVISTKHPFWNRTYGADHFMLSCHDWGPLASKGNPFLYNTSIRVLCNANSSEGFNPQKDVSLPEIFLVDGNISLELLSIPPNNARPYLGFFAGGVHGDIRPILLQHWKGRDNDLRVYEYLPEGVDYNDFLLKSKFCLCPSGFEVASPRIVEAIYGECVPVILSDHYVLPFSDVLNWEAFSIKVEIADIPLLKELLVAVPEEKYLRLKEGLRAVKRHFVFNKPAKKFDLFRMILHSIWLRRLNFRLG